MNTYSTFQHNNSSSAQTYQWFVPKLLVFVIYSLLKLHQIMHIPVVLKYKSIKKELAEAYFMFQPTHLVSLFIYMVISMPYCFYIYFTFAPLAVSSITMPIALSSSLISSERFQFLSLRACCLSSIRA